MEQGRVVPVRRKVADDISKSNARAFQDLHHEQRASSHQPLAPIGTYNTIFALAYAIEYCMHLGA